MRESALVSELALSLSECETRAFTALALSPATVVLASVILRRFLVSALPSYTYLITRPGVTLRPP